jgi:hypothetical protein
MSEGKLDLEQTFRSAVRSPTQAHTGMQNGSMYANLTHKVVYSSAGWSIITFFVVFVLLYLINPPIVQCHRSENDLSKPKPNLTTILILSTLAGVMVWGLCRFKKG